MEDAALGWRLVGTFHSIIVGLQHHPGAVDDGEVRRGRRRPLHAAPAAGARFTLRRPPPTRGGPARASRAQLVSLVRQPDNPHDFNAVRVDNRAGVDAGYLPRELARQVAPLIDGGALRVAAVMPGGGRTQFTLPLDVYCFAPAAAAGRTAAALRARLDRLGIRLSAAGPGLRAPPLPAPQVPQWAPAHVPPVLPLDEPPPPPPPALAPPVLAPALVQQPPPALARQLPAPMLAQQLLRSDSKRPLTLQPGARAGVHQEQQHKRGKLMDGWAPPGAAAAAAAAVQPSPASERPSRRLPPPPLPVSEPRSWEQHGSFVGRSLPVAGAGQLGGGGGDDDPAAAAAAAAAVQLSPAPRPRRRLPPAPSLPVGPAAGRDGVAGAGGAAAAREVAPEAAAAEATPPLAPTVDRTDERGRPSQQQLPWRWREQEEPPPHSQQLPWHWQEQEERPQHSQLPWRWQGERQGQQERQERQAQQERPKQQEQLERHPSAAAAEQAGAGAAIARAARQRARVATAARAAAAAAAAATLWGLASLSQPPAPPTPPLRDPLDVVTARPGSQPPSLGAPPSSVPHAQLAGHASLGGGSLGGGSLGGQPGPSDAWQGTLGTPPVAAPPPPPSSAARPPARGVFDGCFFTTCAELWGEMDIAHHLALATVVCGAARAAAAAAAVASLACPRGAAHRGCPPRRPRRRRQGGLFFEGSAGGAQPPPDVVAAALFALCPAAVRGGRARRALVCDAGLARVPAAGRVTVAWVDACVRAGRLLDVGGDSSFAPTYNESIWAAS
ncbi:hypothetical protein HT031_000864 [Scenedesmus sp. PABB004]|nr:hypothetical protein HT031_000864 [Scenedesmus sp. PABB004]